MPSKKELIAEHEKLIPLLREGTKEEREKEADEQAKELADMKKEQLVFAKNGQWSLVKNWKTPQWRAANEWLDMGSRKALEKLPKAEGKLRTNMLTKLGSHAETRINPETGDKEYKLYRASEKDSVFHHNNVTSWSADRDVASNFIEMYHESGIGSPESGHDRKESQLMHSWIPEHLIHSYLEPHDNYHDKLDASRDEKEALVLPHSHAPVKIEKGTDVIAKRDAMRMRKSLDYKQLVFAKNGQWSLVKSGYGPKGAGLYDPVANSKRKETRTGEVVEGAGRNTGVREYTTSKEGTAKEQAKAIAAKQAKLNAKQPVKTEIPADLKAKLEAEANKPKEKKY